jgi:hypothetical protein
LHESWWELRSDSLHESFLNSHALFKREQELHESWWELRSESLHESFLNSHALVKREQELHESWWELRSESFFVWEFSQLSCPGQTRTRVAWELMRVEKREFAREFSQLSCPGQTRTRVAWELTGYYRARSENSHQLSSKFEPVWWESMNPCLTKAWRFSISANGLRRIALLLAYFEFLRSAYFSSLTENCVFDVEFSLFVCIFNASRK